MIITHGWEMSEMRVKTVMAIYVVVRSMPVIVCDLTDEFLKVME